MIQDIGPCKVFQNEFHTPKDIEIQETDTVFFFDGRTILCRGGEGEKLCFPTVEECRRTGIGDISFRYLFAIVRGKKKHQYFLFVPGPLREAEATMLLSAYHFERIFITRRIRPKDDCFAASVAFQLYSWYRDSVYCGRCGTKTVLSRTERAKICPKCGNVIYPRICPAVIVGVMKDDKILVTRYAGREYRGNALVAGFTEIGETPEGTVEREVMEEVGLHVKNIRYYKSQPWGYASNLLMGFFCEVDGDAEISLEEDELAVAEFIPRDKIGEEARDVSLTADMIMHFKEMGQEEIMKELH
ncbi:MAG: NAD(+) diphosphatase [Lachnospiraceae bacterium]|nr:NAD(+) diphosphatase [Lachnospiraceae bacterium]